MIEDSMRNGEASKSRGLRRALSSVVYWLRQRPLNTQGGFGARQGCKKVVPIRSLRGQQERKPRCYCLNDAKVK
jgi:hypothetical protein